jgi:hypothetical protein
MTALAGIMEDEQDYDQPNKPDRRYISRYLLVLANDPDFEQALIALAANGGRGKIELTYSSGRLNNVDLKLRFK